MRSSYAGSSILARQIIQGADVDVFISANVAWMDVLDKQGLIETESRVNVLGNRLVLIGPTPVQEFDWSDLPVLLGDAPLAMGLVNAVPAGIYGKAALTNLGLWPLIVDRVAQVDNVRAALALVALGEAPFGVVYATDALATSKVSVLKKFSTDSHPPIVYPAAMINNGPMALDFMQFLQGDTAMKVFMRHGFLPSKQTDPNAAEKS
jgi:molybdate transport system substrate-binding protein